MENCKLLDQRVPASELYDFGSVKNLPVNLAKSIKVIHAQYRDIGSTNIYP